MASEKDKVYGKYKILDAKTGAEKHGKYFVLKIDAEDPVESCAVYCAMAMYADYHKTHGNPKYAKELMRYVEGK